MTLGCTENLTCNATRQSPFRRLLSEYHMLPLLTYGGTKYIELLIK